MTQNKLQKTQFLFQLKVLIDLYLGLIEFHHSFQFLQIPLHFLKIVQHINFNEVLPKARNSKSSILDFLNYLKNQFDHFHFMVKSNEVANINIWCLRFQYILQNKKLFLIFFHDFQQRHNPLYQLFFS